MLPIWVDLFSLLVAFFGRRAFATPSGGGGGGAARFNCDKGGGGSDADPLEGGMGGIGGVVDSGGGTSVEPRASGIIFELKSGIFGEMIVASEPIGLSGLAVSGDSSLTSCIIAFSSPRILYFPVVGLEPCDDKLGNELNDRDFMSVGIRFLTA